MADEDRRRLEREIRSGDEEARIDLASFVSRDRSGWLFVWDLPASHDRPIPGAVRVDLFDRDQEGNLRDLNRTSRGMWAFVALDFPDLLARVQEAGKIPRGWLVDMSSGVSLQTVNLHRLEIPAPREFAESQEATLTELLEERFWRDPAGRGLAAGRREQFGIRELASLVRRVLGDGGRLRWAWARSVLGAFHATDSGFFVVVVRDGDSVTVGVNPERFWHDHRPGAHEHPVAMAPPPGRVSSAFEVFVSQPDLAVGSTCGGCGLEATAQNVERRTEFQGRVTAWARRSADDRTRMSVAAAARFATGAGT